MQYRQEHCTPHFIYLRKKSYFWGTLLLFMVYSIISSFCSSPCASTPLLVKSAISAEKYDFVAVLITSFLPSTTTWRGLSSSLWVPATLQSVHTFLGPEQGGQLKGTHQSEYAERAVTFPFSRGVYADRLEMLTDSFREKPVLMIVCNQ